MNNRETSSESIFPAVTYENWKNLAETTLKGRRIDDLACIHEDGFPIHAFYTSQTHQSVLSDDVSASAARHWVMAQYLDVADNAKHLNMMIMDELKGGTERLIFPTGQQLDIISKAMDGVMADAIVLSFDRPYDMTAALDQLTHVWDDQKIPPDQVRGALGIAVTSTSWEEISGFMKFQQSVMERFPSLKVMKISGNTSHRNGATVAQELGIILATFVDVIRRAETDGFDLDDLLTRIEIDIAIDADLYGNIAKARSLRHLLSRICTALDLDGFDLASRLHGITSDRMLSRMDPETNMLRSGTAMLSMALSGLGVITNRPHDWLTGSSPLSRRIARNAHHLLVDESHLNHIADPAQGSYFIDTLTHEISEKAWQLFQKIEREGGFVNAEANGLITAWLDAATTYRQDITNQGKDALLGVTIHAASRISRLPETLSDDIDGGLRGGDYRPAAIWETLAAAFSVKKTRCLLLDLSIDQSAKAIKPWMDVFGLEVAAMSADDIPDGIKLIETAQPDLLVLGNTVMIDEIDLSGLSTMPILRKADAFQGDIILEMKSILDVMNKESTL